MIVGTHTAENKIGTVLRAGPDLDFTIQRKRERQREGVGKGFQVIGCIEQIIFEVDRESSIASLKSLGAEKTGRRLYWIEGAPLIGRTKPEEDLIFCRPLPLVRGEVRLPDIPDPRHTDVNPYGAQMDGSTDWKPGDKLNETRMIPQRLEKLASGFHNNFLVFHPIAQIILLTDFKGTMTWNTYGSPRLPLSSLTGIDDRKMALLIDPYNGEAFITGGRYELPAPSLQV